jgi:hypothetical protein
MVNELSLQGADNLLLAAKKYRAVTEPLGK